MRSMKTGERITTATQKRNMVKQLNVGACENEEKAQ